MTIEELIDRARKIKLTKQDINNIVNKLNETILARPKQCSYTELMNRSYNL